MLIKLEKLTTLSSLVNEISPEFPQREEIILKNYFNLTKDCSSEYVVSVKVNSRFETLVQKYLDQESEEQRVLILRDLIGKLPQLKSVEMKDHLGVYILFPRKKCEVCGRQDLHVTRPDRDPHRAVLYTRTGSLEAFYYTKTCRNCNAIHYPAYVEWEDGGTEKLRKYYSEEVDYFHVSGDTLFSKEFLQEVEEDLMLMMANFTAITDKYNRLNKNKTTRPMNKKRLETAWLGFTVVKRINVQFSIASVRDEKDYTISQEKLAETLYEDLKTHVDGKWIKHSCSKCLNRVVVADGNAKCFRSVCSVRSPKEQNKGELTLFHACTRTPAPGKDKCETHLREDVCKEDDSVRKDLGPMTRARAKALGVEEELLSSGAGCRREERISKRKSREVTSGMLFIYRPCGISLGHCEMISAESCTIFLVMLFSLFGDQPQKEDLAGVVIDRACDVHPMAQKLGREGNEACRFYAEELLWAVDPFHVRKHTESKCQKDTPDSVYHPGNSKNEQLFKDVNMEICEQQFRRLNQTKSSTRYMSQNFRLVFFKVFDDYRNEQIVRQDNEMDLD